MVHFRYAKARPKSNDAPFELTYSWDQNHCYRKQDHHRPGNVFSQQAITTHKTYHSAEISVGQNAGIQGVGTQGVRIQDGRIRINGTNSHKIRTVPGLREPGKTDLTIAAIGPLL